VKDLVFVMDAAFSTRSLRELIRAKEGFYVMSINENHEPELVEAAKTGLLAQTFRFIARKPEIALFFHDKDGNLFSDISNVFTLVNTESDKSGEAIDASEQGNRHHDFFIAHAKDLEKLSDNTLKYFCGVSHRPPEGDKHTLIETLTGVDLSIIPSKDTVTAP